VARIRPGVWHQTHSLPSENFSHQPHKAPSTDQPYHCALMPMTTDELHALVKTIAGPVAERRETAIFLRALTKFYRTS